MLPQIPRMALMHALLHPMAQQQKGPTLYLTLLASALCNSASAASSKPRRSRRRIPRMAERIRNCTTIAAHLNLPRDAPFADPNSKPRDLMQHLCTAASTSILCQEYTFMPEYYAQGFKTYAQGDACLEVALLVVCGYSTDAILHTMVGLVMNGKLAPYSLGGPNVYNEDAGGWRWYVRRHISGQIDWVEHRNASGFISAGMRYDRYVHQVAFLLQHLTLTAPCTCLQTDTKLHPVPAE
jgi:hypothetical protein